MRFGPYILFNVALGAVGLLLVLPFRPAMGASVRMVIGFAAGIVIALGAFAGAGALFGASRDSNIRPVVKGVLQQATGTDPQLLLVGSSYSTLGLDTATIERRLASHGIRVRVLSLSKPGNFTLSQNYTIDYYLARAPRVPDYVFIELGPEYYSDPAAVGPSYITTGTAISDHRPDQFWWRLKGIAAYDESAPAPAAVADLWQLAAHTLYHIFDFGLSGQLIADRDLSAISGFDPQETAHTPLTASDVAPIDASAAPLAGGSQPAHLTYLRDFRAAQIEALKGRGVQVVGYYQPAAIPPGFRVYGIVECRELAATPCITADAPALRRELDMPTLWFDPVHLVRNGAERYSVWFADQIAPYLTRGHRAS